MCASRPLQAGLAGLLLVVAASTAAADEPAWWAGELRVAAGVDFSRGDYGDSRKTNVFYVPFTAAYLLDDFGLTPTRGDQVELRVTVPFLVVDGPTEAGAPDGERVDGVGDVLVRLAYLYYPDVDWPEADWLPASEWAVQVKVPTADDDNGLGTGETDVALELSLFQRFGSFYPYVTGGYRFIGDDTDDFELEDGALAAVGVSWVPRAGTSIGIGYDWRESTSKRSVQDGRLASTDDGHELSLFGAVPLGGGFRLAPYAVKGLSDGSPDYAVGATVDFTIPVR